MKSRGLAILAALVLLGPGNAAGQSTRGAIRGEVVDNEGLGLPGVTVKITSPALIQPRTVITDASGGFNVPALPVGSYTAESSLAGFAPARQDNIRVLLGATASVKLTMQIEGVALDTVVVSEADVLDPTDLSTGDRITSEDLIKVPTARDPWAVLSLVPGIQSDSVNVGGTESGQQANFVGKGDNGNNTTWTIDGVAITDVGSVGSSPTYYDFGAIEEVQVSTGANDVSQLTGGIGINIVTKRGSNALSGSARTFFTNNALQSDNLPEELSAEGFRTPKVDQILELGGEVGGPILKDRLWFWGSANRNKIEQLRIDDTTDQTELINYAGKLSAQITASNEANAFYHFGDKVKQGRTALAQRDQDSSWNQGGGTPVFKVEDQQILGSDTLIAAKFARVGNVFHLFPQGGSEEGGEGLQGLQDADTLAFSRNYYHYETDRPQTMLTVDGSHYQGIGNTDHEFKFGFSYRDTPVDSGSFWDGGGYVLTNWQTGVNPDAPSDTVFATASSFKARYKANTFSLYAADTLSAGNLTLDLGLRYDRQTTRNGESFREANALLPDLMPEIVLPENDENVAEFNLISPRLGASYQLGDRTLAKANYALYADQIATSIAGTLNPITYQYVYSYFDDRNGDLFFTPDELLTLPDMPCGGRCFAGLNIDLDDPGALASLNQVDPDLSVPKTHEIVLGLTHQLAKSSSVGVNFTYRRRVNDTWAVPLIDDGNGNVRAATLNDWVALPAESGDGNPDGNYEGDFVLDPYQVTPWTLKDGLALTGGTLTENRPGYYQRFLGAEFLFQKRFSDRWSLAANLALNDWTEHFTEGGEGDFPNPNRTPSVSATGNTGGAHEDGGPVAPVAAGSGPKANVFLNANWQSSIRGSYTIPRIEVDLGANLLVRQGYPSPFTHRVATDIAGNSGPTTDLLIGSLDDYRMDMVTTLDLRLGKDFTFADRYGLELSADVFNAFNSNVLLQHARRDNAANFLTPTEIIGPRLLRLSARLKF